MRQYATCNQYSTRNKRDDTRPAINTQQETFHLAFGADVFIQYLIQMAAFCGLASPVGEEKQVEVQSHFEFETGLNDVQV